MKIGVMGAMPQEIELVVASLEREDEAVTIAHRDYHVGQLEEHHIVAVFSHWGKVASASTATILLERFGVDAIIFTGVAGAASPMLEIGDVVIGTGLVQHDFDASGTGLFARFELPLLGRGELPVSLPLVHDAHAASEAFLSQWDYRAHGIAQAPHVYDGIIGSGDVFIADAPRLQELCSAIPGLLAVEMEGAAVAQVCYEHDTPSVVIRTISDRADHNASVDFLSFVNEVARYYSIGIVRELLRRGF